MQPSRKTPSVSASASRRPRLPRRYQFNRFRRALALSAAIGIAGAGLRLPLRADTFHWVGGSPFGSTLWELSDNWDLGSVPGTSGDVFNATSSVINYLLNAGSNTINSFTNSGGGAFNINLSDPNGQSFTVNGDVNNLTTASLIDITGVGFNTVTFNNFGGTLNNEGILRVHDSGTLFSFADAITNSGTIQVESGALISIGPAGFPPANTLTNTGTINALSGGSFSVLNVETTNDVNGLLNADGSGSNLGFSTTLFTNSGTIQATNGGSVAIADPSLTLINNNTIQADGSGAASAPIVTLNGDTLTNNGNGYIQAINGNGATLNVDFNTINNNWVITAAGTGSVANINANTGFATLTNTFAVGAGYGGVLNDYTQTINNFAYLDSNGNPSNYLGYGAFRNGQVYVYGDVNNAGVNSSVFNNGDAAGTTPGWVHAFSDLDDMNTYIRIDSKVNNYVGSHITAESISNAPNMPIGAGFQRIDLNVPDSFGNSTDLYNAGTVEALTGAQIRSYASTLTNDVSGLIASDGLNASALALANRQTAPYSSTVYLGDNTKNIGGINNYGTMQATNGGLLSVNNITLANYSTGVITSNGIDAGSGISSSLILGNYNQNINQIINNGTISAVNGGTLSVNFNMLDNSGSLVSIGAGLQSVSIDSTTGTQTNQYTPATLYLNGFSFIASDALINTGTIAASGGGVIDTNNFTSLVPFTNQGTINADGVGVTSTVLDASGLLQTFNSASSLHISQGSYYNTIYVGGTLTNAANGVMSATNGGNLNLFTIGGDIVNHGLIMTDGTGITYQVSSGGNALFTQYQGSVTQINSLAWEFGGDTTGNPTQGGAFLNASSIIVSNGGSLSATANNGLTNAGSISVHGSQNGFASSASLNSSVYTSSNHIANGGNIDLVGGLIDVYDGGQFSANAATIFTQQAGVTLTARDSGTSVSLLSGGDFLNNGLINASDNAALTLNVGGSLTNSATLNANAGATFNATVQKGLTNSGTIFFGLGALTANVTGSAFTNSGTLHTEGGIVDIAAATSIVNSGTIDVRLNTGALTLNGGSLTNSGQIDAIFGASFNGTIQNNFLSQTGSRIDYDLGTFTLNNTGGTFVNNGTIHTEGGVLNVLNATSINNAGTLDIRLATGLLNLNTPGSFTNSGSIGTPFGATLTANLGGSFLNTGTGEIHNTGGTFTTNSTNGAFSNSGILDANGGLVVAVNADSATNAGSLTARNGGSITVQNNAVLNNSGAVRTGASSAVTLNGGETQTGSGSLTQVDGGGTLQVGGSGLKLGTGAAGDGGTLAGNGAIVGNIFNVGGVVAPGDAANAGHLTETGNYTQGVNGALLVKLGGTGQGTDYDLFSVGGTAALAGQLQVKLSNIFTPVVGETFDVMTFTSHTGVFDSVFSLDPGYEYSVTYTGNTATLHFDGIAAVPETGTLVSLGLLLAGGAFALRRQRRMSVGG